MIPQAARRVIGFDPTGSMAPGATMRHFADIEIGSSQTAGVHEMRPEDMIAFARQWDPQPWHVDVEAAERSPMKGLTASSVHSFAVAALLLNRMEPVAGIASIKHEIELPNPARPGDQLTLTVTYVDKRLSESKPDRGLITFDGVLANQHGTVVLKLRSLAMVKTRPTA
jgi:acyl dehydratase